MSVDMEDYDDPDVKVIYVKPALFFTILAVAVLGGVYLLFHESVTDWFAALSPPPANSLRA
jgi:hypothetical protein